MGQRGQGSDIRAPKAPKLSALPTERAPNRTTRIRQHMRWRRIIRPEPSERVRSDLWAYLTNQADRPRPDGAPAPPASGPVEREASRDACKQHRTLPPPAPSKAERKPRY